MPILAYDFGDGADEASGGDLDPQQRQLWGTLWTLVLFALALWWGTRTFRTENA